VLSVRELRFLKNMHNSSTITHKNITTSSNDNINLRASPGEDRLPHQSSSLMLRHHHKQQPDQRRIQRDTGEDHSRMEEAATMKML